MLSTVTTEGSHSPTDMMLRRCPGSGDAGVKSTRNITSEGSDSRPRRSLTKEKKRALD